MSADALAILASAALFLVAALWIALRVGRSALRERRGLRLGIASAIAAGLVVAATAGLLCATRLQGLGRSVVLDPDAGLLVAPYEAATASSPLDPGEVVVVEQRHQDFALVRTASGRSGWVRRTAIESVLPE
jgi:hypothetical protein